MVKKPPISSANASSLLVVTDFSDSSLQAFQWAITEAKMRKLLISVLFPYRFDPQHMKKDTPTSKKELERQAMQKFEHLAQGLLLSSRVPFEFRSEVGFLRDRIADYSRKHDVAMVVMDSQMARMESFSELVAELEIPLVIVPFPGVSSTSVSSPSVSAGTS